MQHLITAATEIFERHTGVALITQDYRLYSDQFPLADEAFYIHVYPVQSVVSILYQDEDNVQQTLASSIYTLDTARRPAQVVLAYDQEWPGVAVSRNAVQVNVRCGYGATEASVPRSEKDAVLSKVAELFKGDDPLAENWRTAFEAHTYRPTYR